MDCALEIGIVDLELFLDFGQHGGPFRPFLLSVHVGIGPTPLGTNEKEGPDVGRVASGHGRFGGFLAGGAAADSSGKYKTSCRGRVYEVTS